jgi:hypothetical protein
VNNEQPSHIEAAIADLQAWQERITAAIETLMLFRTQGGALPSMAPPTSRGTSSEIAHDAFFQMTVPDAADKYLRLMKTTKPSSELATALLKGGLKSTSQNFQEMIRSVLSRDDRFVRVNSEWGLSEWYPAMRKRGADKKSETPQEKKTEKRRRVEAFSTESLKGRILSLLQSHPEQQFVAATIAERLNEKNVRSVNAALAGLFAGDYVLRPKTAHYQFKRRVAA